LGEKVTQVGIILAGKVITQGECIRLVFPQGSYLALNEIGDAQYSATYTAAEDSIIMAVPLEEEQPLRHIIGKNADYRAIMISSQFKMAIELYKKETSLLERAQRLYSLASRSYEDYKNICKEHTVALQLIDGLESLTPYESLDDIDEGRMGYYEEASKIPLSANKAYFSYSEEMVNFQVSEIIEFIKKIGMECKSITDYIKEILEALCQNQGSNLFEYACHKAHDIQQKEESASEMLEIAKGIYDEACLQHKELKSECTGLAELDRERMETLMSVAEEGKEISASGQSQEEKEAQVKKDMASLEHSMVQILKFGNMSDEESQKIIDNVNFLVGLPDRLSAEDDVKKAKKTITPLINKLYLNCYLKIKNEYVVPPKAVALFLDYGFFDERLLDKEQIEILCRMEPEKNEGPCNVVTMTEWLDLIHNGERDPSKSEFDEDYVENLRTLKKQGDITEEQQKALLNNMDKRVEYEVVNMLASNLRTVYGQPSSYMPIMFKEALFGSLDKLILTKKMINESVKNLMKTDYSVFYREVLYTNADLKIAHETVLANVYPDVILMPIFGTNASMWQEVGGKDKKSPGRFCFPIMSATNLDDMMTKMFGRFHWELCRCIQGMSWNDVKVKSLTSEYMDYIQFYRKNHDLSDDAKDKVKLQIQKSRNNSRETFLLDYEAWIKNESNGSMKLNKVAREIMATYVPFNKELRERLNLQKPYELAQARFIRTSAKKKQEIAVRIKAVQKITSDVPSELMDTYKYYAEK
jgi:hypothetical protein